MAQFTKLQESLKAALRAQNASVDALEAASQKGDLPNDALTKLIVDLTTVVSTIEAKQQDVRLGARVPG